MKKYEDSLEFVTRHYRSGAFRPERQFVRFWTWRRPAVAASVAIGILAASAALYTYLAPATDSHIPAETTAPATKVENISTPKGMVVRITFEDTPLARVVSEIENVYGVKVDNIGDNGDIHLTLSYEGTAEDLIETINDTLGTNLTIEEKK